MRALSVQEVGAVAGGYYDYGWCGGGYEGWDWGYGWFEYDGGGNFTGISLYDYASMPQADTCVSVMDQQYTTAKAPTLEQPLQPVAPLAGTGPIGTALTIGIKIGGAINKFLFE